jgi:hypothetical protein
MSAGTTRPNLVYNVDRRKILLFREIFFKTDRFGLEHVRCDLPVLR